MLCVFSVVLANKVQSVHICPSLCAFFVFLYDFGCVQARDVPGSFDTGWPPGSNHSHTSSAANEFVEFTFLSLLLALAICVWWLSFSWRHQPRSRRNQKHHFTRGRDCPGGELTLGTLIGRAVDLPGEGHDDASSSGDTQDEETRDTRRPLQARSEAVRNSGRREALPSPRLLTVSILDLAGEALGSFEITSSELVAQLKARLGSPASGVVRRLVYQNNVLPETMTLAACGLVTGATLTSIVQQDLEYTGLCGAWQCSTVACFPFGGYCENRERYVLAADMVADYFKHESCDDGQGTAEEKQEGGQGVWCLDGDDIVVSCPVTTAYATSWFVAPLKISRHDVRFCRSAFEKKFQRTE